MALSGVRVICIFFIFSAQPIFGFPASPEGLPDIEGFRRMLESNHVKNVTSKPSKQTVAFTILRRCQFEFLPQFANELNVEPEDASDIFCPGALKVVKCVESKARDVRVELEAFRGLVYQLQRRGADCQPVSEKSLVLSSGSWRLVWPGVLPLTLVAVLHPSWIRL
ncbi:hypothetical protein ElyMa_006340400 [Elysia marginata]|uniref:Secreted protein n=1 Tax=Elysia marginata TaxID=1093978 RepID=A0AAV4HLY5_9GAST|nr:hypothetical protein ElyMa_006340400 [Elysia marginata]